MTTSSRPRILLVCTANICRSPMAAALLQQRLEDAGVTADVVSAGLVAPSRQPAHPLVVAAIAARGGDLDGHRSRGIDPELLALSDLVIGLAREHVREVVIADPDSWTKAFTLKELVRRATAWGARPAEMPLAEWISRLHEGRDTSDLLGRSPDDDVADPIKGDVAVFDATVVEIEGLIDRLASMLWPTSANT